MLAELGLIDVWRESHQGEKQFTYYSPCHCVYSQIDDLFISKSDWHRFRDCKIGIRDVSDHSGVYLTLFITNQRKNTLWRLNTSILNDKTVQNQIQQEFKTYLQNNDNGEVSPNTLWDAAKAVVRGKIIALTAFRKKEKQRRLVELQEEMKSLEISHTELKDPQILTRINKIKQDINCIYEEEIEKQLKFTKQRFYETGPRAIKLLSWRIRKQRG